MFFKSPLLFPLVLPSMVSLSPEHGQLMLDLWAPGLLVPGLPHVEDGVSGTDSESWGD